MASEHHPISSDRPLVIRYRTPLVTCVHAALFAIALLAAFTLAYNFRWTIVNGDRAVRWFDQLYLPLLVLAVPIKLAVFNLSGQYRGSWRRVGLRDLFGVISASLMSTFLFLLTYFVVENVWYVTFGHTLIDRVPNPDLRQPAVFFLDWAATVAFVSGTRVLVRFYYEDIEPRWEVDPTRVLIIGAGNTGEAVLRELLRMRPKRYECVGLLDDEAPELRASLHGVEIVGRTDSIRDICTQLNVQEVLIALSQATPKTIRELVERCEGTGVKFRTLPALRDLIEGRVQVNQIREVDIADLLGREPVELDADRIGDQLRGKRVLVTGAGGSIGSEMCRQIVAFEPSVLVLVEQAENNLFQIDSELRRQSASFEIIPCIADITDSIRIQRILEEHKPSIVFHAAAHKHVPMMECNTGEAIKNNVGGTSVVADACLATGVARMVTISTDKAVNPTSVMGCSKRVAEMYVQGLNDRGATQFVTVRFGNVLGSSGSVIPIFREQIARGGPVTVTDPEMVRFFMTIPEAAQLVLQAGAMAVGGEIYVLHMGDPVKIVDLARDMITLSGLKPGVDIEISYVGKRPGEKLYEELSSEGENIGDTAHPKIGIWKCRIEDWSKLKSGVGRLLEMADAADKPTMLAELKRLVPEFTPDDVVTPTQPTPAGSPTSTT